MGPNDKKNGLSFSSLLGNIFKTGTENRFYKKNGKALGLSRKEFVRLKLFGHWEVSKMQTIFFNRPFIISSAYWFLQSIEEIFVHEVYKFKTTNPRPIIIDCGANWGLSVIYFKLNHPQAVIAAFEADQEIFEMARKNIETFGFESVTLHHKAVWNSNGSLVFSSEGSVGGSVSDLGINSNSIDFSEAPPGSWIGNYNTYFGVHKIQEKEVESVRLRDVLKEYAFVDFLKIDIEGAEHKVLMDCEDELHRVDKMFIEYHSSPGHPQYLDEILRVITNSGLRYYIKEAAINFTHPFIREKDVLYDLQLNIFCFR
ncbi:FkbM family methyltransferase [Pedobacter sp. P351]|uniref:FkbM family methyltransferase n=1 Tax=Pedobacter superstes TaxID=3133441 RepID=UPI0030A0A697